MKCQENRRYQIVCPYIRDRLEISTVSYKEAIYSAMPSNTLALLQPRIDNLIQAFPGSLWFDDAHKNRMEVLNYELGYVNGRNTRSYYATMFLLTANQPLYRRTANCFCYKRIEFSYAALQGINAHNYTLFQAARLLCDDDHKLRVHDLADPQVVDDEAFRLFINAFLIAMYGLRALNLTKGVIDTNE